MNMMHTTNKVQVEINSTSPLKTNYDLDPLQFTYRPLCGVEDASLFLEFSV